MAVAAAPPETNPVCVRQPRLQRCAPTKLSAKPEGRTEKDNAEIA
jgi:hypothetical protein